MMYDTQFNMTSLLVLTGVLVTGLLLINLFGYMEQRKLKKKMDKFPKTFYVKKNKRATQKEIDRLLEMDDSERFYHS